MSEAYAIYRIFHKATGKSYIGLTRRGKRRIVEHFSDLSGNIHHSPYLQNAFNKYGRRAFSWLILEAKIVSLDKAKEREKIWIDFYDSYNNGYNMTEGGDVSFTPTVPCTWNDIEYLSITSAAEANGVNCSTMWHRLKMGWLSDEDVVIPAHSMAKSCTWNGIEYQTIAEAAEENGVTAQSMGQRISKGYTRDADLNGMRKPCIWNGIEYQTIAEAAKDNGVHRATMEKYMRKGYTCTSDVPLVGSQNRKSCVWNGVEYQSITKASKANDIHISTMSYRLSKGYTCNTDLNQWANED